MICRGCKIEDKYMYYSEFEMCIPCVSKAVKIYISELEFNKQLDKLNPFDYYKEGFDGHKER